jgi:D-glycero-alpha-D-manno-heptose-7-phosphate kinase
MQSFRVTAPTRVDLSGGTLDLWPLYCLTEGAATINLAISVFVQVRVQWQPARDRKLVLEHPQAGKITVPTALDLNHLSSIPAAVKFPAYIVGKYLAHKESQRGDGRGFHATLSWSTDAPIGSGLGGSSTLAVALARAMSQLFGDYSEQGWQWRLMAWVRDAEAAFLKVPTGTQDYLSALFGGLNRFDSLFGEMRRVPYSPEVYQELGRRLVVIFSGEQHHSGKSNWEVYQGAIGGDPKILGGIRDINGVTAQMDSELRSARVGWASVGRAMKQEWKIRREVFKVQTPRLDEILAFLDQQGVLGSKVCGAAQGGSLIALVAPERREDLVRAAESQGLKVLSSRPSPAGVEVIHS